MAFYFIIMFIILLTQTTKNKIVKNRFFVSYILCLMFALMVAIVLLNPLTGDMEIYLRIFNEFSNISWLEALSRVRWEPGFVTYQWRLSKITNANIVFILTSTTLMWIILILALKKIIKYKDLPLVMFGYMNLFVFYNLFRNIVRQGIAVPLLLLMLLYLAKDNYKNAFICLGFSISFHISAVVGIILIVIKKLDISMRSLLSVYIISALLMISNINQKLMLGVAAKVGGKLGDTIFRYSSENIVLRYGVVNRIDFLIFTTFWLLLAIWFKNRYLKDDLIYTWIVKSYIGLSSVYILFGFIGFSDRIAAYSWFLIPILLTYPVVEMKSKYRRLWIIVSVAMNVGMFWFFDVISLYEPISILF